jgi:hypothetical protein
VLHELVCSYRNPRQIQQQLGGEVRVAVEAKRPRRGIVLADRERVGLVSTDAAASEVTADDAEDLYDII